MTTAIPSAVKKYIKYLVTFLKRHNLERKIAQVQRIQRTGTVITTDAQRLLEEIDRIRTEGMLAAEKRCRKLRMGNIDFSPEMSKLKQSWGVLSLIIKKKMGGRVNSRTITRRAKRCNIRRPGSI